MDLHRALSERETAVLLMELAVALRTGCLLTASTLQRNGFLDFIERLRDVKSSDHGVEERNGGRIVMTVDEGAREKSLMISLRSAGG
jgi:hypothetical protein